MISALITIFIIIAALLSLIALLSRRFKNSESFRRLVDNFAVIIAFVLVILYYTAVLLKLIAPEQIGNLPIPISKILDTNNYVDIVNLIAIFGFYALLLQAKITNKKIDQKEKQITDENDEKILLNNLQKEKEQLLRVNKRLFKEVEALTYYNNGLVKELETTKKDIVQNSRIYH